jgi:hypothetical protein
MSNYLDRLSQALYRYGGPRGTHSPRLAAVAEFAWRTIRILRGKS